LASLKRLSSSGVSRSRPALCCSRVDSRRQRLGQRQLAGEVGMRLDQRALLRLAALGGGARHRLGEPVGAVGLRA